MNRAITLSLCSWPFVHISSFRLFYFPLTQQPSTEAVHILIRRQVASADLLTVGTLLGTGTQEQLGHGRIVGHDGDIKGQEAFAVWRVEVQLLQTVLRQ